MRDLTITIFLGISLARRFEPPLIVPLLTPTPPPTKTVCVHSRQSLAWPSLSLAEPTSKRAVSKSTDACLAVIDNYLSMQVKSDAQISGCLELALFASLSQASCSSVIGVTSCG